MIWVPDSENIDENRNGNAEATLFVLLPNTAKSCASAPHLVRYYWQGALDCALLAGGMDKRLLLIS